MVILKYLFSSHIVLQMQSFMAGYHIPSRWDELNVIPTRKMEQRIFPVGNYSPWRFLYDGKKKMVMLKYILTVVKCNCPCLILA